MKDLKNLNRLTEEELLKTADIIGGNYISGSEDAHGNRPAWGNKLDLQKLVKTPRISRFRHGGGGGESKCAIIADPNGGENFFYGWEVSEDGTRIRRSIPNGKWDARPWRSSDSVWSTLLRMKPA